MQHLLTLNPEHARDEEVQAYAVRHAARAVIKDADGRIALLHVKNDGYYKLPGGGIEEGESKLEALKRECLEEAGCAITILEEVGSIVEYRKMYQLQQTSYCYLVAVEGEKGEPEFTHDEIEKDFELVWLSYTDAQSALADTASNSKEGSEYIVPRDATFLKAVAFYF